MHALNWHKIHQSADNCSQMTFAQVDLEGNSELGAHLEFNCKLMVS